jgi:hypothetical protein
MSQFAAPIMRNTVEGEQLPASAAEKLKLFRIDRIAKIVGDDTLSP